MTPTEIVIIISLISITAIIVIVGIYLVSVLKETQKILTDTRLITSSIARPVSSFSEFVMGFKNGFTIFNKFFPDKDKKVNVSEK